MSVAASVTQTTMQVIEQNISYNQVTNPSAFDSFQKETADKTGKLVISFHHWFGAPSKEDYDSTLTYQIDCRVWASDLKEHSLGAPILPKGSPFIKVM